MSVVIENDSRTAGNAQPQRAATLLWPIVLAGAAIAAVTSAAIWFRLSRSYPRDPWEAIVVADAYRASAGMVVYAQGSADHSTHMYGPLITYLLAAIYKFTGVRFITARLLSVFASAGMIAALTMIFFRGLGRAFVFAGVVMLAALNIRSGGYFTQTRPDMLALAAALLALILLYQGFENRRWLLYALGIVALCTAYLFKQTAATFTLVPPIILLLRRDRSVINWMLGALPFIVIVCLIAAISVAAPEVHYYMVEVPARWNIDYERLLIHTLRFLGFNPLLLIALCILALMPRIISLADARMRWLIAASVAAAPTAIITMSKHGGDTNSYLPAMFPITVFSMLVIARAWQSLAEDRRNSNAQARGFAWLIAALMILVATGGTNDELRTIFGPGMGDDRYWRVVKFVSQLDGTVASPDDPTIPIMAGKKPGRSSWAEHDALASRDLPDYLVRELRGADWIVLVDFQFRRDDFPEYMPSWQFVNVGFDGQEMGPYSLWRQRRPDDI